VLAVLVVLFVAVPLVELALIVWVGGQLGVVDTLGLLILCSLLGALLVKHQGLGVLRRVRAELDAGRLPAAALLDGVAVLAAGALLLTPGFLTDALGLVLLLPPARRWLRGALLRRLRLRIVHATRTAGTAARSWPSADVLDR
jgi:UPF0716 protein FxsA